MSQWWPQISWFAVGNLAWTILIPILIPVFMIGFKRTKKRLAVAQVSVSDTAGGWFMRRRMAVIKGGLFSLSLLLLIISSAGPRWGWTWVESRQSGIDMVVAVDVSRSMMARDLEPTRLERARRMMIDLLEVADGDRIGLVVFAGAAFVQCPLTVDHAALRSFVDGLNTEMIPIGGTDLAGALRESMRALDAGGEEQGLGKLIVLMTDGEDHKGGIDGAIADVIKSKTKVVTVGLASPSGSPVMDDKGAYIKDRSGDVVVSRLMEEPLRKIAEDTGGVYINGASGSQSVSDFYQNVIRAKGTIKETQALKERIWFERFQWTAALGLGFLILEYILMEIGRTSAIGILIGALLIASANDNVFAASSSRDRYNDAVQLFESGDMEAAAKAFAEVSETARGEEQRRSLYNLGNIMAAAGKYDDAVKLYEKALTMDYQDQQVRDNLAWARKHSKSEQNKNDQKKDKDNKQDQKDGQKGDEQKSDNQKADNQKSDNQKSDETKDPKQSGENDKSKKDKDQESKNESRDEKSQSDQDQGKQDQKEEKQAGKDKDQGGHDKSGQEKSEMAQPSDQMTPEQAEKLLRAAPDDRKSFVPIFRGQKLPEQSGGKDW